MKFIGQTVMMVTLLALGACGGGSNGSNNAIGSGSDIAVGSGGGSGSGSGSGSGIGSGSSVDGGNGNATAIGSDNGNIGNTGGNTSTTTVRIAASLASGDPSGLQSDDAASLLDQAIAEASSQRSKQAASLTSIYGNVNNLSLSIGKSSAIIGVQSSTSAVPLIVADSGAGMAAITMQGSGRGVAYGADTLQWMAGTTKEQQHYPLFLRTFNWLMTGSGDGPLPGTIKFATAGYTASSISSFIIRAGKTPEALTCPVAESSNACWKNADVIVFGGGVPANAGLIALVQQYLSAGKAVIYMHSGWGQSAGGTQVLAAMGMTLGGYPGNYFADLTEVSVSSGRTIAQSLSFADKLTPLVNSLSSLKKDTLAVDLASDTSLAEPYTRMLNELAMLNSAGINIFGAGSDRNYLLHRLLVLWADQQRTLTAYGNISRSNAATFLRAYASDAFLWFARSATRAAATGQGDYMPTAAQTLTPSSEWEDIEVTLPQTNGVTLVGRGAIPARGIQIEVVDAAGTSALGIQTSYLRSWGNPLTDSGNTYARPLRPHSFNVALGSGTTQFVTPNGGPLMLSYSGATVDTVVKLRIKGTVKYSHFDYTRAMSDSDVALASAALKAGTFGWQTTKVRGGEIQQIMKYAKSVIGDVAPEVYANNYIRDGLFMSNHITNGYNDAGMTPEVASLCVTLGWTCDGSVHKEPVVQHFVGWIATCGFLCSGNPIDGSAGIGLGWGYAHEMGHNTVQRVLRITPDGSHGCVVECDNNILASATAMRVWETQGLEFSGIGSGHQLDHAGMYSAIVANRGTGLTGDAQVSDMESRIWGTTGSAGIVTDQNIMRTLHFQLAFLYTKHRSALMRPNMTSSMNYFSLLNKGDRLVAKTFTTATAANYGMGRYTVNTVTNHDLLYMLSSKLIGRDLRKIFSMYGIPLSSNALDSIADLSLPVAPRSFYALPNGKHNQLATGQWLDLENTTPAWPF